MSVDKYDLALDIPCAECKTDLMLMGDENGLRPPMIVQHVDAEQEADHRPIVTWRRSDVS